MPLFNRYVYIVCKLINEDDRFTDTPERKFSRVCGVFTSFRQAWGYIADNSSVYWASTSLEALAYKWSQFEEFGFTGDCPCNEVATTDDRLFYLNIAGYTILKRKIG